MPSRLQFAAKIFSYTSRCGAWMPTLCRMRRRNASSTRSFGSRFVLKMMSCSNGTWNFLPLDTVRKSCRSSSGRIHRFSSSFGLTSWRPKSSIRNTPPFALKWIGAW